MDRGLTGAMLSLIRAKSDEFAPNEGAQSLKQPNQVEMLDAMKKECPDRLLLLAFISPSSFSP